VRQLQAAWSEDGEAVVISRDGEDLLRHPVEFVNRNHSWYKPNGNAKTAHGGIGILSCLSNGCFRSLTGCGRCTERCYAEPGRCQSGCYADLTAHAMIRWNSGFSVIHNGYHPGTEGFFHVRLPKNGSYDLSKYGTRIFRVDSESATSCMSLALGITQKLAEANPRIKFTGISSDYFHVPDSMLEWAARCGNVVIGHTVSPWFAVDDLSNRIEQAHRWQAAGVPTMLWVATRDEWRGANPAGWAMIDEELGKFHPEQLVEVPYHDRSGHAIHTLRVNPLGGCCEVGVTPEGEYHRMDSGHEGKLIGSCRGCKVMCGVRWLNGCRKAA
jgi:hypothetical protein